MEAGIDDNVVEYYLRKMTRSPAVYLLEQPTGAGKSTLASVLAMKLWHFGRINSFIFVRTHTLVEEYFSRIRNLAASYEYRDVLVAPVMGKDLMCLYGSPNNPAIAYSVCRARGNGFDCPDYRATVAGDPLSTYMKEYSKGKVFNEIVEKLIEKGFCPYYSLKFIAKNSPIIVATYNHLTDSSLFTATTPMRYVVFIDEAHNLMDLLIDSRIKVFNIRSLRLLQTKFESVGWKEEARTVAILMDMLRQNGAKDKERTYETLLFLSEQLNRRFAKGMLEENILVFEELLNRVFDGYMDVLQDIIHLPKKFEGELKILRDKLILQFPSRHGFLSKLINSSLSTMLMSATLSPTDLYVDMLGKLGVKKPVIKLSKPYLFDPLDKCNISVKLLRSFTSRYVERSPEQISRIVDFLIELRRKTLGDIYVFLPSKDLSRQVYDEYLSYVLGTDSFSPPFLIDIMDEKEIENMIRIRKKVVFMTHRGRYSEGVNLFRSVGGEVSIVIYGLSILPIDDLYDVRLSTILSSRSRRKLFLYGYIVPAINYIIQVIGRFVRPRRSINIYLLERRALKYFREENLIPEWFREKIIFPRDKGGDA